jgi:hypothetical protein
VIFLVKFFESVYIPEINKSASSFVIKFLNFGLILKIFAIISEVEDEDIST